MKVKMHVHGKGADGIYIITYKSGKFHRLEHQRGKVSDAQFEALMRIVPPKSDLLDEYIKKYERVTYEQVDKEPVSLFKKLIDKYHQWYHDRTGIAPRIDGITGSHLKKIITWLSQQSADESEVELSFQLILDNWHVLPEFYQKQIELRQLNSNLNIILNHVKNGKSDSSSKARSFSDDLRQSI